MGTTTIDEPEPSGGAIKEALTDMYELGKRHGRDEALEEISLNVKAIKDELHQFVSALKEVKEE